MKIAHNETGTLSKTGSVAFDIQSPRVEHLPPGAKRLCREIWLISHPNGVPSESNFTTIVKEMEKVPDRSILVRNLFMSVDPYMRGRMNSGHSYMPPFKLGEAMTGGAVGEVIESCSPGITKGDIVSSDLGWREYYVAPANEVRVLNTPIQPLSLYLGALGMTGMTAWAGLRLIDVMPSDVVYISGAAGAVGCIAGQLAKLRGCRVIGSAGSSAKVDFLINDCRFDSAFNYKTGSVVESLNRESPEGIDVYFDNVGGESLEAALSTLRDHGRIIACGGISSYNQKTPPPGPTNLMNIVSKRLTIKGLMVRDWLNHQKEFEMEMTGYLQTGAVENRETVVEGIGQAVGAFIGLFDGNNIGKMIVKI